MPNDEQRIEQIQHHCFNWVNFGQNARELAIEDVPWLLEQLAPYKQANELNREYLSKLAQQQARIEELEAALREMTMPRHVGDDFSYFMKLASDTLTQDRIGIVRR